MHHFLTCDKSLSVGFENCQIIQNLHWIKNSFPSQYWKKYVTQCFVTSCSRCTEIFSCKIWLLQKILILCILLFEQDFSNFQIQFVSVLSWNRFYVINYFLDWILFNSSFLLSIFNLQIKSVDFKFTHIFSKWLFKDCQCFISLS